MMATQVGVDVRRGLGGRMAHGLSTMAPCAPPKANHYVCCVRGGMQEFVPISPCAIANDVVNSVGEFCRAF